MGSSSHGRDGWWAVKKRTRARAYVRMRARALWSAASRTRGWRGCCGASANSATSPEPLTRTTHPGCALIWPPLTGEILLLPPYCLFNIYIFSFYAHPSLIFGVNLWGSSAHDSNTFILQRICIRILLNVRQADTWYFGTNLNIWNL